MPEKYIFDETTKVWVGSNYITKIPYCDGLEIEEKIYEAVKNSTDITTLSEELESHIFNWTSLCFLSKKRSNLLRPFASWFKGKHILEPGCGAGPITRFLGECGAYVYAVEPNLQRAKIAAERCRDLDNVKIYCDDIESFDIGQRFDGIIQVGVLEYATKYSAETDAPLIFINRLKKLLKEDGFLITAIENQLGLKYFSGFAEDHVGVMMHSINNNYQQGQPTTFGKKQLIELFEKAGFETNHLFLPFPDYKLPSVVIYPGFYEKNKKTPLNLDSILSNLSYMDQQANVPIFSMDKALPLIAQNGLLYDLSNSFCLFSQLKPANAFNENIFLSIYNTERKKEYCKETLFTQHNNEVNVTRNYLNAPFTHNKNVISFIQQESAYAGTLYHYELTKIVNQNNWTIDQMTGWLQGWFGYLKKELSTHFDFKEEEFGNIHFKISSKYLDAIPINLIVNNGQFRFIDLEIDLNEDIELGYLIFRAIYVSITRLSSIAAPQDPAFIEAHNILYALFTGLGFPLTEELLNKYYECEALVATAVAPVKIKTLKGSVTRLKMRPPITDIALFSDQLAGFRALQNTLQEKENHIQHMENDLNNLKFQVHSLSTSRKKMVKQFLKRTLRYSR